MDIFSCPVAYVYTPVMEALAEAGGGKPPSFLLHLFRRKEER
jgi:hypothetical protein